MTVMPRPVDRANPVNALVISDETLYFNNAPGSWRRITVKSPDSDEIHVLLTNEMNLPPGVLGEIYRLRWRIELVETTDYASDAKASRIGTVWRRRSMK